MDQAMDEGREMDAVDQGEQEVREARRWSEDGWTAQVIKNEDDEGWAVAMFKQGQVEPALVGPWTMGRDKKNPKPLDRSAFLTLVKTAGEFVGRLEQQRRAALRKEVALGQAPERVFVSLEIVPDEDYPYGVLEALDEAGERLGRQQVEASFKLGQESAQRWVDSGYSRA